MGTEPKIIHVPNLGVNREIEDDWIGAYAVATTVDGVTFSKFLSSAEILKRKARSKSASSDYSPWKSDPKEMYLKTPVRTLAKFLPLSPETEEAIRAAIADEYEDAGISTAPEVTDGSIQIESSALPPKDAQEAPLPQERPKYSLRWRDKDIAELSEVPTPVLEQAKFRDLCTKSGKVWLTFPACIADLMGLFDECGYELVVPATPLAGTSPAAATETVDEEIGI